MQEIQFTKIHTFPFSLRNGTAAEQMSEHFVAETKKKERVHRILDLSCELEKKYYEKFVNETLDVIIEQTSDGISKGHTSNYILVNVDSSLKEGDKISRQNRID